MYLKFQIPEIIHFYLSIHYYQEYFRIIMKLRKVKPEAHIMNDEVKKTRKHQGK